MNTDTGEIGPREELARRILESVPVDERSTLDPFARIKPISVEALTPRARRELESTGSTQVGRNSPCPCGSGYKFKRCCWSGKAPLL